MGMVDFKREADVLFFANVFWEIFRLSEQTFFIEIREID
jgi:hypothetical protein